MHQAKAFKYGDDINTDYIISGKYKFKSTDMEAMARPRHGGARPATTTTR